MTPSRRKWAILALVLVAECMDLLDGTIVNVAAPTIHNDLHSGTTGLQWIISGYALAFAMVLITGGRLGDIYGRRRLFVIGALGFVAASVACGFSSSPGMLIACRLVQGSAAALLVPQGLGIIRSVFGAEEQGSAFALFGPVIGLSAMLGPIIGGSLIAANLFGSGWRLVFFVNLPLGLIAAIGAALLMPESRSTRRLRLDLVGSALAALGMGLLVYPLTEGQSHHWPAWTYLMFAASATSFAALVGWNRRVHRAGGDPLVEPSIFGHRAYVAGLSGVVVFFAGLMGTMLVMTLYLQFGEHFTPLHAGLTLAPFALGSAIGATLAAALLAPRLGRRVLQIGAVVVAGAVFWLRHVVASHGLDLTSVEMIGPELGLGIGLGMGVSPLFDFILASVADHEVGSASGVLNATQQLAGAIGVAGIGTIFFTALSHGGYVVALNRCLLVEIALMPVLIALVQLLPKHAHDSEAGAAVGLAEQRPNEGLSEITQAA
jgi:EmrB/QacA subfamily drug resistance transporter